MKILNFGSLNIDFVYSVDHIVAPGETISSHNLEVLNGGKGLNQSIALSRAGATVFHSGMVGPDGDALIEALKQSGVNTDFIHRIKERTGNAIIQVASSGQNSIVLSGGANQKNTKEYIDLALADFDENDWLLLQNEINLTETIIKKASAKKIKIALNPSPYTKDIASWPLDQVSLFFVNEIEGGQITGYIHPDDILRRFSEQYPHARLVLTLGPQGCIYQDGAKRVSHSVYKVPVVDTTAAGDTFTGYFLHGITTGKTPEEALRLASIASSIAVSRKGAEPSIPWMDEVEDARFTVL